MALSEYNDLSLTGRRIAVTDCTLREGEQSLDVALPPPAKLAVARALADSGVDRVQVALDDPPEVLAQLVRDCAPAKVEVLLLGFRGDLEDQVGAAREVGIEVANLAFRSSAVLLGQLGWSEAELVRRSCAAVELVAEHGLRPVFSPTDTTRARPELLSELYQAVVASGTEEVYVCDTVGIASPSGMRNLVSRAADAAGVPVAVHCHNDLGVALANALAACEAGAVRVDTCVNGLGERCGNPSLDELAVAVELLLGGSTGVDLGALTAIAADFADLTGQPLPGTKAVVGPCAFAQKMDIHVEASVLDETTYVPFAPGLVGSRIRYAVGKKSGPATMRRVLEGVGYDVGALEPPQLRQAVAEANNLAGQLKRALTTEEVTRIVDASWKPMEGEV